jgi:hypothetical protein
LGIPEFGKALIVSGPKKKHILRVADGCWHQLMVFSNFRCTDHGDHAFALHIFAAELNLRPRDAQIGGYLPGPITRAIAEYSTQAPRSAGTATKR